jgi:CheY-like chemotaxis protein
MKIFLVDDDDVINLVHTAIIKGVDPSADIEVFLSGLQLLNRIKSLQPHEVPNYVFLDIRMPEMSGLEVLNEIDKLQVNPIAASKIFVLSSTLDERDLKEAVSHKTVSSFLSKPLTFEALQLILATNA